MKLSLFIIGALASSAPATGLFVRRHAKQPKGSTGPISGSAVRRHLKNPKSSANNQEGAECVKRRPDKISFKYEGGTGSISQYQPDKATCKDQDFPMSTTVTVYGQEFAVSSGQEFTVFADGGKFDANTVFSFSSGDVSDCTVHTSCSQPLVIGDKIGPFVLVDGPTGSDCSRNPETCICCEPVCTCEARASYENGLVTLDFDYCGEANPEAFDWIGIYPCDAETMVADDAWNDYVFYEDVFNVGFVRDKVYVNEQPVMWSYTCGSPGEYLSARKRDYPVALQRYCCHQPRAFGKRMVGFSQSDHFRARLLQGALGA